ncbi:hypothetical protein RHMOL_Rhmol09G0243300 [Rhododendron molle]|uniref:Uncharacterized protein n=1 Tax=Rhododendron molle TaxID=49168 RepID=A0ACC0MI72_RHOML|nr:hypothetical protein RHMOL_Rhmol09G0243300 [Rhododendron molle]
MELLGGRLVGHTRISLNLILKMDNMLKKVGWTRHAKFARKILGVNQGKWTRWAGMLMWLVWISLIPATSLPDSSPDERGELAPLKNIAAV